MKPREKAPPHIAAGMLLCDFVEHEQINGEADTQTALRVVARVYELLEEANQQGITKSEPHRILAIKEATAAIEKKAADPDASFGLPLFDAAVENHQGGPREIDLGGRKIKNKLSAREYHKRAAVVVLWQDYPDERDRLVEEAKKYKIIKSKRALAKVVDNHNQKHMNDETPSPLSAHIPTIRRQIKATGCKSLDAFIVR